MNPCDQPGVNDGGVQTASTHLLDLSAEGFSLANARELALYARMAYSEPPTVQDEFTDTQVLIRDLGDCVVVAFRGTSDLRDFLTDAECWRAKVACGEVHSGFWKGWLGVKYKLVAQLPINKPIFVCGHSLGGALAIICGKYLAVKNYDVGGIYTFGAPRVGDKTFQKNFDGFQIPGSGVPNDVLKDRTFTLIHDCDLVPRIPGWLSGYRRPGHDEFMSSTSKDIWEDPSVPLRLLSDLISIGKAWLAKHGWLACDKILTDHRIDNYIAALSAEEVQS